MKKTIFRLSALVLALVMLLAMLSGCKNPSGAVDNGGNGGNTDNTTITAPIQITTTIHEIAKHGNLILYMYGSDLYDKGFEHGDIVEIAIGDKKWDVPLCTSYSDVDNGETVLRAIGETDGVVLAINMGDFATTAGIAQKTAIDEEPGYRWDYLMESNVQITITMKEEGGYREEWLIRQLVRTNERTDYAHLGDEAFANFRVIQTTGMGKGVLYRSSSPINPELGRNTYADKAAEKAGIITVVNLADPSNMYEGTENTYYSTCKVTYVNLGMDFLSEATLNGLAEGMRFIINNNGPYLIHCNEGKDRAGFVSALLECLMGATIDEVIDDYMVTYYNYYGVEKGTEKYDVVVKNNLIKSLNEVFKVEDVYKADLAKEAEAYLIEDAGLTADEVTALKGRLTITLQEIYNASKTEDLLKNHESVYIRNESDGEFWRETYLTKDYSYDYMPDEVLPFLNFMTDDANYYYDAGHRLRYFFVTPDGVGDFVKGREEYYSLVILGEECLDDIIESVIQKDGRITVKTVMSQKTIDSLVDFGVTSGRCEYVLDAKTREIISIFSSYTFADGTVSDSVIEMSYDVEMPEVLKEFLEHVNSTEDLRNVTIVINPGTDKEEIKSIQAPKGMVIGFEFDIVTGYEIEFYTDAACTEAYDPYAGTDSDLTVYVKWVESVPEEEIRYTVTAEEWEALVNEKNYTWERINNGEVYTIQKYTEYAMDIDGTVYLYIEDKIYQLVEEEDGWFAYDCTYLELWHLGLLETFDMIDFEYDESKQAYLYKYWEEYGYKLEVRFENGIHTSLTMIEVGNESNVSVRLVHNVGTTVIEIPEYTIVEDDYDYPVYSYVTEEVWNSFAGGTNFEYYVFMSNFVGSDFYSEVHTVKSVGNAISVDDVIYVLEDGKYYVLEETASGWIATESELPTFCFTSLLEGLSYNDFDFDENTGFFVPKEDVVEDEPYSEVTFDENGILLTLFIYNDNLSDNPETEGMDLSTVISFSNIGTTVISVPEYTVVR